MIASTADLLNRPMLPMSNALLLVELAQEHGQNPQVLLAEVGIASESLSDDEARLSVRQCTSLMALVSERTGIEGLGYEIGFRTPGTALGMVGFGVMSSSNLLEALDLATRYFQLRNATFGLTSSLHGDSIEVALQDLMPQAPMRQMATEWVLVSMGRLGGTLIGSLLDDPIAQVEMSLPWPEPSYHGAFQSRLPRCRFNAPTAALRFPLAWVTQRLEAAAPSGVQMARRLCERELELVNPVAVVAGRVRALLAEGMNKGCSPSRKAISSSLHLSESTLKRRLQSEGFTFSGLVEEARHRQAVHLLNTTALRVEDIAVQLGYHNTANFTRAFRQWAAVTPSAWRKGSRTSK